MGSCSGRFYCLDKDTGEVLWTYDTKADGAPANFHGNVLLSSNLVIVGSDIPPAGDGYLYAFDQASGEVWWKHPFEGGVPVDVIGRDGDIFIVTLRGEAICLAQETGDILWRYEGAKAGGGRIGAGSLLLEDAFVFTAQREVVAVHPVTGEVLWQNTLDARVNTSIVLHKGKLYVGDISGGLHRLSPEDGSIETTFETGGMPYGSLSACDAGILVLWWNGSAEEYGTKDAPHTFACLDPSLEKIRWQRKNEHEWMTYRPLLGEVSVVVGDESGVMLELDTKDGAEVWSTTIEGTPRGLSFVENGIIIGTLGGTVYALER